MNAARAFPWHAIERVTRDDAVALRFVRQAARDVVRVEAIAEAASALTNARVSFRLRSVRAGAGSIASSPSSIAAIFAIADADPSRAFLVEAESTLAAAVVARAISRTAPRVIDPARTADDRLAGAFAAIVIAAARKAHAGAPLRVIAAGDAGSVSASFAARDRVTATFTVLVDDDAHLARVSFARDAGLVAPSPKFSLASLAALGDVAIALPIVACESIANALEIAALREGDAWMPATWSLARDAEGHVHGEVRLGDDFSADLEASGRLVLRSVRAREPADATEGSMDAKNREVLVEALGDAPIVVRVEIGAAEMTAREWASIAEGDVIALGRKIAEPVILRAGATEIARGELIEIDGEVGVRIVELRGQRGA